jgi:hypothetical protein
VDDSRVALRAELVVEEVALGVQGGGRPGEQLLVAGAFPREQRERVRAVGGED